MTKNILDLSEGRREVFFRGVDPHSPIARSAFYGAISEVSRFHFLYLAPLPISAIGHAKRCYAL